MVIEKMPAININIENHLIIFILPIFKASLNSQFLNLGVTILVCISPISFLSLT